MNLNFILSLLAIPGFLILIFLEYRLAQRKKMNVYNMEDSITNISIGIFERFCALFTIPLITQLFDHVYLHYKVFDLTTSWIYWVLLFFVTDFLWYWYHRLSHEINVFWSAHVVHHSSEEYNLTVAARITLFQQLIRTLFWLILPLAGFNSWQILSMLALHAAYQLFLHTQLIVKLGWIEHVFVTPSHHRVHHGSNPQYIDKNYGGVLILWDKLFGTFAVENEKVNFGITENIKTNSFLWTHFHFLVDLLISLYFIQGTYNKIKLLIGKPNEYIRNNNRYEELKRFLFGFRQREKTTLNKNILIYIAFQFFLVLSISAYFQLTGWEWTYSNILVLGFLVITLINCCALLEKRSWIIYLEYVRMFIVTSLVCTINTTFPVIVGAAVLILLAIIIFQQVKLFLFTTFYK